MPSGAQRLAEKTPTEKINDALRESVVETMRRLIPSLQPYSNEEAFNVILNSPEMADRSFRVFRANPEEFADIMHGPEGDPVGNDNDELSCGRNLAQIVTLIVRAVAKRYFRAKLGLSRRNPLYSRYSLLQKWIERLFLPASRKAKKAHKVQRSSSVSDQLYYAMQDNLLFEWQLLLIPYYVGLPIHVVQDLGVRLLEFREIDDIRLMVRTGQALMAPTGKLALIEPEDEREPVLLTNRPVSEARSAANRASSETIIDNRKINAALLSQVNIMLVRRLMQDLALNPRQLADMLTRAHEILPAVAFEQFSDSEADSPEADCFIAAARATLFGVAADAATAAEFARLYRRNMPRPG